MKKLLSCLMAVCILMFPSYAGDTLNEKDSIGLVEKDIPLEVSTSSMSTRAEGAGIVNSTGLNVRENPNEDAPVLITLSQNDSVIIFDKIGDWYCVNFEDIIGFVHSDYIDFLTEEDTDLGFGAIKPEVVNVRASSSSDSTQVGAILEDEIVSIEGIEDGWYKIEFNGLVGYVRSDLIDPTALEPEPEPVVETPAIAISIPETSSSVKNNSSTGAASSSSTSTVYEDIFVSNEPKYEEKEEEVYEPVVETPPASYSSSIVDVAYQYLGVPYVWGGTSPSGFDCSGFVQYVFSKCGYSLSRTADAQYYNGYAISYSSLAPGDLVFFVNTYATSGISHVGIYVGDGAFIHCANGGVKVSYLSESYYSTRYYSACRIG